VAVGYAVILSILLLCIMKISKLASSHDCPWKNPVCAMLALLFDKRRDRLIDLDPAGALKPN